MEKGWSKIKTYLNPIEAEIVRLMLVENGIPAVVLNKQDSSYHFGKIELLVQEENVDIAMQMIDDNENVEEGDVN